MKGEDLIIESGQPVGRVEVDLILSKGGDGLLTLLGFACDKYLF